MKGSVSLLDGERLSTYEKDGYLVRKSILSPGELEGVAAAFTWLVKEYGHDRARADFLPRMEGGHSGGAIIQKKNSRFFFQIEKGVEADLDDADRLEMQVRKFMWFEEEAPVFKGILAPDGPILPVVRQILKDEPLLFQSMALVKPPKIGSTKPWHQDNAYFSVSPLEAVCGVWIALDEATVENGCMHMLKGGHHAGAHRHEHKRDCEISVDKLDLKTLEPIPLKPGGALFFSGMVPHMTPPNRSSSRRRALQFHFRGARSKILPGPEYDQLFRDAHGEAASCEAVRREGV